jgi:hypothetical protein
MRAQLWVSKAQVGRGKGLELADAGGSVRSRPGREHCSRGLLPEEKRCGQLLNCFGCKLRSARTMDEKGYLPRPCLQLMLRRQRYAR